MIVRYDDVIPNLTKWVAAAMPRMAAARSVLVRDLRSQVRLIVDIYPAPELSAEEERLLSSTVGAFKAPGSFVVSLTPEQGFDELFMAPDAVPIEGLDFARVRFLDRMVTGREWLYPEDASARSANRLAFFGIKGGVGRSTAVSMSAWWLARQGLRVLVVDLDLESPGLGDLLLPFRGDLSSENDSSIPGWPSAGLVDWFIEDAVEQADDDLIRNMLQPSPLAATGSGEIIVCPAAGGLYRQDYVSKLSRVYADLPSSNGIEVFGDRLSRALHVIETHVKPDVVLIDSRAGIHHISAAVLSRLCNVAYLFALDNRQTWAGYQALFSHWSIKPQSLLGIREKIRLVSARTPQGNDKNEWRDRFGEHAYNLFYRLYDEENSLVQSSSNLESQEIFNFGVFEDGAPHRPIIVWDSPVYSQFDPLSNTQQLHSELAEQAFKELFMSLDLEATRTDNEG